MKKAFTLIELVFVFVVIGILAAFMIPSTRTNPAVDAAIQLESDIRYAQHLAMIDDKFDANNTKWFSNLWKIEFTGTGNQYEIANDNYIGLAGPATTFASEPLTQNTMQNIDLNADFGVTIANGCGADISFDHLGRPIIGDLSGDATVIAVYGKLLTAPCDINLTNGADTATIRIENETGYTRRIP